MTQTNASQKHLWSSRHTKLGTFPWLETFPHRVQRQLRGVTQFGRVLGLGPRCRRFKSCRLDQKNLVKLLTMDQKPAIINRLSPQYAGVAQLVEQLICNQQVGGSSPSTSSTKLKISYGRVPEWPKGADCKSVASSFGGSNPPSPTKKLADFCGLFLFYLDSFGYGMI